VRVRIKDKRVLALVNAFLKAGSSPSSATGKTPGSALLIRRHPVCAAGQHRPERADKHVHGPWLASGAMSTIFGYLFTWELLAARVAFRLPARPARPDRGVDEVAGQIGGFSGARTEALIALGARLTVGYG
jgi:hypothetical protein